MNDNQNKMKGGKMKNNPREVDHQKTQDRIIHECRAISQVLKQTRNLFAKGPLNPESWRIGNRFYDEEMRERYRI